jgi:hypothetical protein
MGVDASGVVVGSRPTDLVAPVDVENASTTSLSKSEPTCTSTNRKNNLSCSEVLKMWHMERFNIYLHCPHSCIRNSGK